MWPKNCYFWHLYKTIPSFALISGSSGNSSSSDSSSSLDISGCKLAARCRNCSRNSRSSPIPELIPQLFLLRNLISSGVYSFSKIIYNDYVSYEQKVRIKNTRSYDNFVLNNTVCGPENGRSVFLQTCHFRVRIL